MTCWLADSVIPSASGGEYAKSSVGHRLESVRTDQILRSAGIEESAGIMNNVDRTSSSAPGDLPIQSAIQSSGRILVRLNLVGTAMFLLTATFAAVVFSTFAQWVGAVTALILFAIGVFTFLWAYWNAVQRSRSDQIAVTQLYFLVGEVAPRKVRVVMNSALFAQVLIATVTALGRPNGPEGRPGSSLAVGFLVPMFGFGLNGLWAAYHGRFLARLDAKNGESDGQIGQNASHG